MKSSKEITNLESETTIIIVVGIILAVISIVTAIAIKNIAWVICGILWITIAVEEYGYNKIIKCKDWFAKIQEKHIKIQNNMIYDLLKKLNDKTYTIKLADIKIPEHFIQPRKDKLKRRIVFFNKNKKFATPIIIDKDTKMLLDGYTSYLIAKKYNFEIVQVVEV